MTQGFGKRKFTADESQESNKRRNVNQNDTINPALLGARDSTIVRSEPPSISQNMALGYLGRIPTSRSEARRVRNLLHQGRSSHEDTRSSTALEPRAAPSILPSQSEVDVSTSKKANERFTRSSKKRTRVDAGSYSEIEDDLPDTKVDSRRSTRRSKRAKVSPEYNDDGSDDGEKRKRKTSKLKAKIAAGKGPQKGSLGPAGEVRIRKDGRMEFRDVNNPEWTLAAYHNNYRRQFLDEAAEDGEFNHIPTRGEAANDETSFEPEQQSWGPERADWHHIVNSEGVKVMFEVDKPKNFRPPHEPSNWIHDGLVLLDSKNHPVKDWPGLNKTLSSAIESWRLEALTRMYPWLTVTDLLARMPHTRMHKGKVLPLQTPQAFTNSTYRLRVANQIPASKMKNGSAAYKQEILKNLAEKSVTTTEALSTLNPDQIEEVRKVNKGKFKRNSRYVVKDEGSRRNPPPSKKRKARDAEDTESEPEQEEPKAKKPFVHMSQNMGAEPAIVADLTPGFVYDNTFGDSEFNGGGYYNAPTDASGLWYGQEQDASTMESTYLGAEQSAEDLVPLFATTEDQQVALLMDSTFTNPSEVIWARRNGNQNTTPIGVYYYLQSTPRHIDEDGMVVADVAHDAFSLQWEASEPIPNDVQQHMPPAFNPELDDPSDGVYPGFLPPQTSNAIPLTPVTGMYGPNHGIYPNNLTQTPNYPLVTPGMGSYAPSHGVYPDVLGQAPNYPSVTPVTTLQAPLPFQNQIGRYQAESDAAEEVLRNQYGSTGF